MTDYSTLKVAELRDLLNGRGISSTGLRKQELIDALEQDDNNDTAAANKTTTTRSTRTGTKRKAASPADPAVPAPAKQAKKPKAEPPAAAASPDPADDPTPKIADAQIAKAGARLHIPVDEGCPHSSSYHVYVDPESGVIFDASLNQTNASNNNNKFYRLQVSCKICLSMHCKSFKYDIKKHEFVEMLQVSTESLSFFSRYHRLSVDVIDTSN